MSFAVTVYVSDAGTPDSRVKLAAVLSDAAEREGYAVSMLGIKETPPVLRVPALPEGPIRVAGESSHWSPIEERWLDECEA